MSSMNDRRRPRNPKRKPVTCWQFLDRLIASRHRFRRLVLLLVAISLLTTKPDALVELATAWAAHGEPIAWSLPG